MSSSIDQKISKAESLALTGNKAQAELIYRAVLKKFPLNKRAQRGLDRLKGANKAEHKNTKTDRQQVTSAKHFGRWDGQEFATGVPAVGGDAFGCLMVIGCKKKDKFGCFAMSALCQ